MIQLILTSSNDNDYPRSDWWQKRRLRRHFYTQSYKMNVDAGQSSIRMLNGVKEIEKIFRQSRTIMASSSQIQ